MLDMNRLFTALIISVLLVISPRAFASDQTALMVLFIPGLVFLVLGSLAVCYALTTTIENYWLQLGIRIFSVAILIAPTHISGVGYWWPNAIGIFFNERFSYFHGLAHSVVLTFISLFLWWLFKNQPKV